MKAILLNEIKLSDLKFSSLVFVKEPLLNELSKKSKNMKTTYNPFQVRHEQI
jgi:hypothetical protein